MDATGRRYQCRNCAVAIHRARLIRPYFPPRLRVHSRVAQVVEQVTVNHRVGGSSPSSGAFHNLSPASENHNGHFLAAVPVLLSFRAMIPMADASAALPVRVMTSL